MPDPAGGWVLAFITSFDGLTVTICIANRSATVPPVRPLSHLTQTADPPVASIPTMIILFPLGLLPLIEWLSALDRLLAREAKA